MAALWITPFICACVSLCMCLRLLACTRAHTLQLMFLFLGWFFFSVRLCVCLHVLVVTSSSAVPPSLCDRQIARLLCSLLFGGCHQTLLVQPVIQPACVCVCVRMHGCVGDRVCALLVFLIFTCANACTWTYLCVNECMDAPCAQVSVCWICFMVVVQWEKEEENQHRQAIV